RSRGGGLPLLRRALGAPRRARARDCSRHAEPRHHRRRGTPPDRRAAVERRAAAAGGSRDRERRHVGRAAGAGEGGVGRGHWLIVVAALWASAAHASGACDEGRSATGFSLAVGAGVLAVDGVDPGSPAGRAGLRPGDSILQVNDVVPRACAQFARALTAARDEHKALLLLVRRGDAEVPLALGAATWGAPPP